MQLRSNLQSFVLISQEGISLHSLSHKGARSILRIEAAPADVPDSLGVYGAQRRPPLRAIGVPLDRPVLVAVEHVPAQ